MTKKRGGGIAQGKAKDAGGLTPAKGDNAAFAVFNVSEAVTLLNQNIQEEIEQYKQKPPSESTDFYINEVLMHDFTNAAILVAECLYDYYQTGELVCG